MWIRIRQLKKRRRLKVYVLLTCVFYWLVLGIIIFAIDFLSSNIFGRGRVMWTTWVAFAGFAAVVGALGSPTLCLLLSRRYWIPFGVIASLVGIISVAVTLIGNAVEAVFVGGFSQVALALLMWAILPVRYSRFHSGQCPRCEYQMHGRYSRACPECGWRRSHGGYQ